MGGGASHDATQDLSIPMIEKLYGSHYDIHPLYCKTDDTGHSAASRDRVYVVLVHRQRAVLTVDIQSLYHRVAGKIRKLVQTEVSDYLVSGRWEILREAQDLARARRLFWPRPDQATRQGFLWVFVCFFVCGLSVTQSVKQSSPRASLAEDARCWNCSLSVSAEQFHGQASTTRRDLVARQPEIKTWCCSYEIRRLSTCAGLRCPEGSQPCDLAPTCVGTLNQADC